MLRKFVALTAVLASLVPAATSLRAADNQAARSGPKIQPASDEGANAIKGFQPPAGYKVELAAAEPLFANPVSFTIDEQGRFYVAETFRFNAGVLDIRGIMHWLDEELASKSVPERVAYTRRRSINDKGEKPLKWFTDNEDRISLVWDSNGDGVAETSSLPSMTRPMASAPASSRARARSGTRTSPTSGSWRTRTATAKRM
jgi:quinoprotein glucose dehydrogenase